MTHAEKVKEMAVLEKGMLKLVDKMGKLSAKPAPKTAKGAIGRAVKILALALQGRMTIAQIDAIRATPIPKYPSGTIHPGGRAVVGMEVGPEVMVGPDGIALAVARESIRPLPHCDVVPQGALNHSLQMSAADVKKIISERNMPDLVAVAVKGAYARLPDFAPGGTEKPRK